MNQENGMRVLFSRIHVGLAVSLAAILLVGCKVEITVPEGGRVVAKSDGSYCDSGQTCSVDVYDIYFNEEFVAIPNDGNVFDAWKKKDRGLCGGSIESCHLYTSEFSGNPTLMSILESDDKFYLEPIFRSAPVAPATGEHLLLYGGSYSDEFIGCITCEEFDLESICNAYGDYGSRFSSYSIWNRFGDYGSEFSAVSPWNRYANNPPAIYDTAGTLYGYLTADESDPLRTTNPTLIAMTDYVADDGYELDVVRNWFCE